MISKTVIYRVQQHDSQSCLHSWVLPDKLYSKARVYIWGKTHIYGVCVHNMPVFMYILTHLSSHYFILPALFCLDDWRNGRGTEKVKWLASSSSMWMRGGRRGRWGAWNCCMVMNLQNWDAQTCRARVWGVCWNSNQTVIYSFLICAWLLSSRSML